MLNELHPQGLQIQPQAQAQAESLLDEGGGTTSRSHQSPSPSQGSLHPPPLAGPHGWRSPLRLGYVPYKGSPSSQTKAPASHLPEARGAQITGFNPNPSPINSKPTCSACTDGRNLQLMLGTSCLLGVSAPPWLLTPPPWRPALEPSYLKLSLKVLRSPVHV